METMNRLLLIDGHNLLFKAFFGIPEKLNAEGKCVHGVFGFISMTVNIIRKTTPTHVLVVFDPEETPSRTETYAPYKSNRKDYSSLPDNENPFTQLKSIKKGLDAIGIKFCEQSGAEADDLIASYTGLPDFQTVIVSSDTDFFQLVNRQTIVYHYHSRNPVFYNIEAVTAKFGIPPARYLEYKALVGDKSDNISGVRGIGPKNALKVLNNERQLTPEEQTILQRNVDLIRLNAKVVRPYEPEHLVYKNHLNMFPISAILKNAGVM
jgi:DNA polymerase I